MTGVPWLTSEQAAMHLGFPSVGAFHTWLSRERRAERLTLKVHWLRGRMRFRQVDLDRVLEPEGKSSTLRLVKGAR